MKAAEVSIKEWVDKEDMVYTHTDTHTHRGILLNPKKEGNSATWDNMDGPWGHNTKWNKEHRERQMLYDLPYKWNSLKKKKSS